MLILLMNGHTLRGSAMCPVLENSPSTHTYVIRIDTLSCLIDKFYPVLINESHASASFSRALFSCQSAIHAHRKQPTQDPDQLPVSKMNITYTPIVPYNVTGPFFVPGPNYRGTLNIFFLCVSTLVICVWNAIHLDVPMSRQGRIKSLLRNVGWKLGALIVPELFLMAAFAQYLNARALRQDAQKYLSLDARSRSVKTHQGDPEILARWEFTLTHGFYAAMGGYAFDFLNDDGTMDGPAFLPDKQTRITITASGIRFLMEHMPDLIPDLPKTYITDRSEGGILSKAILILQVSWFCTNCIARLAQHLPLTLLEVTTVAHAVCTLLTYAVWWAKPLNIAEPTLIRGPKAREACAMMKMCSQDSYNVLLGLVSFVTRAEMTYIDAPGPEARRKLPRTNSSTLLLLQPDCQYLDGTGFMPNTYIKTNEKLSRRVVYRARTKPWYVRRQDGFDDVILESEDVCRWKLASKAETRCWYQMTREKVGTWGVDPDYVTNGSTLYVQAQFDTSVRQSVFLFVLPAIYGSVHFLGWNSHFPTPTEHTLWRIATTATTFWGAGFLCVNRVVEFVYVLLGSCCFGYSLDATTSTAVATTFMTLLYAAATGFLLGESVRQLLYLDPASYELPVWSNYWPHFG